MTKKIGRPTRYTREIGIKICEEISKGGTLRTILANNKDMPHMSRVYNWLHMPSLKTFQESYKTAVVARTEAWADQVVEISDQSVNDFYEDDDGNLKVDREAIQRSKLRVETRLKLMAKINPRQYGDKPINLSDDDPVEPIKVIDMRPQNASGKTT
jgi:hypothetical protein